MEMEAINVGVKPENVIDVVDVQLAQSHSQLMLEMKLGRLLKERKAQLKNFVKKFNENKDVESIGLADVRAIATKDKKARGMCKKIEKLTKKINTARRDLEAEMTNPKEKVVGAFVTFEKVKGRNEALAKFGTTPFEQCCHSCCSCCYKDSFQVLEKKYLRVEPAADAQNILWEHLSLTNTSKFLRRLLSLVITISLWVITFTIIVLIKDEQQKLASNVRPTVDCTDFSATKDEIAADYALGAASKGYVECYCRTDTFNKLNDVFNVNGSNQYLCQTWLKDYSLVIGLPFVVAFGILIINIIMRGYYSLLARFEGHRNLTKELGSKVLKVFISQFLNTGLIILIISAKFTNKSPIPFLRGQYDDMTTSWYYAVGATILLTMFMNVFSFPLTMLASQIIKKCLRRCDRGCTSDVRKTKKKKQEDYVNLYSGHEFHLDARYSQVLTLLFICFLYGSGLPLLYFFTFLQLIFLYWTDKCFLLRINKIPQGYDEYLAVTVRRVLYYVIILHLAFSIWNFGNSKIFENSDIFSNLLNYEYVTNFINTGSSTQDSSTQYYIERWLRERLFKDQTIILSILLFFFAAILIIKFITQEVLKKFFTFCCMKCKSLKLIKGDTSLNRTSYYDVLSEEEIKAELPFVREKMAKTMDETLRAHLGKRLMKLEEALQKQQRVGPKFLGIFSYDIRHNPKFKEQFGIDVKSYQSHNSPQVVPQIEPARR